MVLDEDGNDDDDDDDDGEGVGGRDVDDRGLDTSFRRYRDRMNEETSGFEEVQQVADPNAADEWAR